VFGCHQQGRLPAAELLVYMLQHDIALQTAMQYYCANYKDCDIKYQAGSLLDMSKNAHVHMQQFLYDASIYYLTLGFVVFRFTKIPFSKDSTLVPIAIPIHDIEWEYQDSDYSSYTQTPTVNIRSRNAHDQSLRFYVHKFRCNFVQGTQKSAHGILFRLVHLFRRLVHAQDYNLIIRNEGLRKTVFVEQTEHPEKETTNWKLGADRGELQAVMDNARKQRVTKDPPVPPPHQDEGLLSLKEQPPPPTPAPPISRVSRCHFYACRLKDPVWLQGNGQISLGFGKSICNFVKLGTA